MFNLQTSISSDQTTIWETTKENKIKSQKLTKNKKGRVDERRLQEGLVEGRMVYKERKIKGVVWLLEGRDGPNLLPTFVG